MLRALAVVDSIAFVDQEETLAALEELHVWTEETVLKRFHYRKPGLWVLGVRVFRRGRSSRPRGDRRARRLQDVGPPRPARSATAGLRAGPRRGGVRPARASGSAHCAAFRRLISPHRHRSTPAETTHHASKSDRRFPGLPRDDDPLLALGRRLRC